MSFVSHLSVLQNVYPEQSNPPTSQCVFTSLNIRVHRWNRTDSRSNHWSGIQVARAIAARMSLKVGTADSITPIQFITTLVDFHRRLGSTVVFAEIARHCVIFFIWFLDFVFSVLLLLHRVRQWRYIFYKASSLIHFSFYVLYCLLALCFSTASASTFKSRFGRWYPMGLPTNISKELKISKDP